MTSITISGEAAEILSDKDLLEEYLTGYITGDPKRVEEAAAAVLELIQDDSE